MNHPPQQRGAGKRRRLVGVLSAVLVCLLVVLAVLIVLLVRGDDGRPITRPEDRPPSPVDADPTSGYGTQNFRFSQALAVDFVAALVEDRAEDAHDVLCVDALDEYPDAAELQARFDGLLGGEIVDLDPVGLVGDIDTDFVTFFAHLDGGDRASFAVLVVGEGGVLAVCGLEAESVVPRY